MREELGIVYYFTLKTTNKNQLCLEWSLNEGSVLSSRIPLKQEKGLNS